MAQRPLRMLRPAVTAAQSKGLSQKRSLCGDSRTVRSTPGYKVVDFLTRACVFLKHKENKLPRKIPLFFSQ